MNNSILVIIDSDAQFTSFRTYDRVNGSSPVRFIMETDEVQRFISSDRRKFYDRDLNNLVSVTKCSGSMLRVEVFYIGISDAKQLSGRVSEFCISADKLCMSGRHLCGIRYQRRAKLHFSGIAQHMIASFNKKQRRALSKALRDSFIGFGSVEFYFDYGMSFYFTEQDGISGGLIMYTQKIHGSIAYSFSIHT